MMIKFGVSKEYHATYTIGLVRSEAETIMKIVHAGLGTDAFTGTDQDIGHRFLKVLQKQLTVGSSAREDHE